MSDIKNKNLQIDASSMSPDETFTLDLDKVCEDDCSSETSLNSIEYPDHPSEEPVHDKKHNPHLDLFMGEMEKITQTEAKVKCALAFMESSLAQSGTPHFRSFWEVRNICLQLFKENLPPALRSQFWTKYSELSKEARRLKELLDEQSSFAAEQIEIAVVALENDIAQFEEQAGKLENPDLGVMPKILLQKKSFYENIQKQLNFLNLQASRINSMRKELIKTEMRVRQKNKFFQRLSQAGDKIFPLRKELIRQVSDSFSEDVDHYINSNFGEGFQDSLYILREEIKSLQGIAKVLTLNTHAFSQTRMRLSECWDKIKIAEKERKKERAQLKAIFKQNFDIVQQKIQHLQLDLEAGKLSDEQAHKQLDDIPKLMRQLELGRDEIKVLRDELFNIRNQLLERIKTQEKERHQHEVEKERYRKTKIDELKNEIGHLSQNVSLLDTQELISAREELFEKSQSMLLNKFEKQEVERLLKPLRSAIADTLNDKEEQALLSLSDNDRQALDQLKEVLKQRKQRRQEIKKQLETLRKVGGNTGLDFVKAMNHFELIKLENERLEKINQGIKEIEEKIVQLQKKK